MKSSGYYLYCLKAWEVETKGWLLQRREKQNKEVRPAPVSLQPNRNGRRHRTCSPVSVSGITFLYEVSLLGAQLSLCYPCCNNPQGHGEGSACKVVCLRGKPGSPEAASTCPPSHSKYSEIAALNMMICIIQWWYSWDWFCPKCITLLF